MWICLHDDGYGTGETPEKAFEDAVINGADMAEPEDCKFYSVLEGPKRVTKVTQAFTFQE